MATEVGRTFGPEDPLTIEGFIAITSPGSSRSASPTSIYPNSQTGYGKCEARTAELATTVLESMNDARKRAGSLSLTVGEPKRRKINPPEKPVSRPISSPNAVVTSKPTPLMIKSHLIAGSCIFAAIVCFILAGFGLHFLLTHDIMLLSGDKLAVARTISTVALLAIAGAASAPLLCTAQKNIDNIQDAIPELTQEEKEIAEKSRRDQRKAYFQQEEEQQDLQGIRERHMARQEGRVVVEDGKTAEQHDIAKKGLQKIFPEIYEVDEVKQ